MIEHDDIERRREANEGVHPGEWGYDEEGEFGVGVTYQTECEERIVSTHRSLRTALTVADELRLDLNAPIRAKGLNPAAHVCVRVVDMDDGERGSLDWDLIS